MLEATKPPKKVPSKIPSVMRLTMIQSTAPRLWCAIKLDTEVNMMLASDVPSAKCMMTLSSMCCQLKQNSSMGTIFKGRPGIDYFIENEAEFTEDPDGATTVRRGLELLDKTDENGEPYYDVVVIYTMKYDDSIHETWPESPKSLHAMRCHNQQFAELAEKTAKVWAKYDTLLAYVTDHGIHADHHSNDGAIKDPDGRGNHYADIPEDMNVTHFFGIQPAQKA